MTTKKTKDNNDLQLFHEEMQDVRPLINDRVTHAPKKKPLNKRPSAESAQAVSENIFSTSNVTDCDVILRFERPGLQKPLLKTFRQGKMPIEASLDLHGYTSEQARTAMIEFMRLVQREQLRVVCIVHGKGFGSNSKQPVIKPLINKWLQELNEVLAFSSAQPKDGGTGAVYVLLRKDK
ncbi:MAG: Smr/MutS family endonuclease [Gammaproteobacteria bacterium]|nr:Smr/MutS family endonuclease [Gammaproteobacteria bacterium]